MSTIFLQGFLYHVFLDRGLLLTREVLRQGFIGVKLKSSLRKIYCRHHDLVNSYGIYVSHNHGYFPFFLFIIRSFPESWLITGFVVIVTWWVPYVEQELSTLPEHMSSIPDFGGVRLLTDFVRFPYTASTYPFGIFKLFVSLFKCRT